MSLVSSASSVSWASLHCHSDCSLLDAISKPKQIIKRCVDIGISAAAITDHGSLGNTVSFIKAKKQVIEEYEGLLKKTDVQEEKDKLADKISKTKTIKQILGCELYLSPQDPVIHSKENGKHSHLVTLCKNKEGWKAMLKITAEANKPENFYRKPRTHLDRIAQYANGNLVTFSGHMGSDLANCIFTNIDLAYNAKTYDEAKALVDPDWKRKAFNLVGKYQEVFGKENFFIEIQLIDQTNLPAAKVVADALRFITKKTGVLAVATADSHYLTQKSAQDQQVLLCNLMGTTLKYVMSEIEKDDSDVGLAGFFRSNNYHIPTPEEMIAIHTEEEVKNSLLIASMCEDYDIMARPSVPKFDCPNNLLADEYLRKLCRDGFKNRVRGKSLEHPEQEYVDRIKEELAVFSSTDILCDYLLIVQDYVAAARADGEYVGPSRGSGGGCLTNYLIGITGMDPIEFDLSFARFYNAGRNTKDRISLPDIDCDFGTATRWKRIQYCREKYGRNKVCQMGTYSRMMGRSVLKDVLRVHSACSPDEMNKITEFIPDEAAISDQLQEMREAGEESSIIKWSLDNHAKELKEWCFIEGGKLKGPFAKYFAQGIRLEGIKRSQGKHASGVIISDFVLDERIPMVRDKSSDELITGVEMNDVESLGGAKFDILGVAVLSKIMGISQLLSKGYVEGYDD